MWFNGVGKNKETDQEHVEDCVEEEVQFSRLKFERERESARLLSWSSYFRRVPHDFI